MDNRAGFCLKELFPGISLQEISFLSKHLKRYLELEGRRPLPKRTLSGERYPSNQWDFKIADIACSLLWGFREYSSKGTESYDEWKEKNERLQEFVEQHIDYPSGKWGYGTANYDGDWQVFMDDAYRDLLDKLSGKPHGEKEFHETKELINL
jgi:hypothetical protein